MRNNITYAKDPHEALVFARYKDQVAYFELLYDQMTPENRYEMKYRVVSCSIFAICTQPQWKHLIWTKKLPIQVKNIFREHFGLKPLKEEKE